MAKKYYWLKIDKDFFNQPKVKKLRRVAGGDTFTLIYLKLHLLSLENDGILIYERIEKTFAEELSLIIDEDANNIQITLQFLQMHQMLEEIDVDSFMLYDAKITIGSESESANRVRKMRERKKELLQSEVNHTKMIENTPVSLQCNGTALHCNADVTQRNGAVTSCNTEKRRDREEIEKRREEIEKSKALQDNACVSSSTAKKEFEVLWKEYPNKKGKADALKHYVKLRTRKVDPLSYDAVKLGIDNYNTYIYQNKISTQFVKHGSTWFKQECWNDDYDIQTKNQTKGSSSSFEPEMSRAEMEKLLSELRGNWEENQKKSEPEMSRADMEQLVKELRGEL